MIQIENITKKFDTITAIRSLTLSIEENKIFGLLGTNGAGKSTLLRLIAGVIKPDEGSLLLNGRQIYETPSLKEQLFYISDDGFFFPNTTPDDMADYYALCYPSFSKERLLELLETFGLDKKRKIKTFSKGMKKQLSILLGICSGTAWLLCDESFDGLDPVMRQAVKTLFAREMCDRDFTPVIASHNLRELEDICDHVGLLHEGGILLSEDLENLKNGLHKVQMAFPGTDHQAYFKEHLDILLYETRGSLVTVTARGDLENILAVIREKNPVFLEALPLSLEEIFISETGVQGYDIKNLLL